MEGCAHTLLVRAFWDEAAKEVLSTVVRGSSPSTCLWSSSRAGSLCFGKAVAASS